MSSRASLFLTCSLTTVPVTVVTGVAVVPVVTGVAVVPVVIIVVLPSTAVVPVPVSTIVISEPGSNVTSTASSPSPEVSVVYTPSKSWYPSSSSCLLPEPWLLAASAAAASASNLSISAAISAGMGNPRYW